MIPSIAIFRQSIYFQHPQYRSFSHTLSQSPTPRSNSSNKLQYSKATFRDRRNPLHHVSKSSHERPSRNQRLGPHLRPTISRLPHRTSSQTRRHPTLAETVISRESPRPLLEPTKCRIHGQEHERRWYRYVNITNRFFMSEPCSVVWPNFGHSMPKPHDSDNC